MYIMDDDYRAIRPALSHNKMSFAKTSPGFVHLGYHFTKYKMNLATLAHLASHLLGTQQHITVYSVADVQRFYLELIVFSLNLSTLSSLG